MQININHNQPLEQPVIPRAPMANRQNFCERVVGNLRALAEHVGRTIQIAVLGAIAEYQLQQQQQQQQQRRLLQDFLREQNLYRLARNIALDRNLRWALTPPQVHVLLINFLREQNNARAQAILLNASAQRLALPQSKEVSIENIEKDVCPIIYEPLRKLARKGQLVETRCGHQYSRSGINTWLAQKPECPKCRKFTTKNDLINITVKTKKVAEKSSALKAKKEPKKIPKPKKSVQSQAQRRK